MAVKTEERLAAAIELLAKNIAEGFDKLAAALKPSGQAWEGGTLQVLPLSVPATATPASKQETKIAPAPNPCKGCGKDLNDDSMKHSAACEVVKPNGKKASPEELLEEVKKLVVELAQKSGRESVVKVLDAFGVKKASDVPVLKLPEFVATLRAAVAKAS